MRRFSLGMMLWSVAVIAACFATYRVDLRFAPLIATFYAAYFLVGLHAMECASLSRYLKVGAATASIGVVCWMIAAFSLDWMVYLQSESTVDVRSTALFFGTCLLFVFAYWLMNSWKTVYTNSKQRSRQVSGMRSY